ncbi:MAG TPA: universal stress protein [Mycobacterium sp.]|jgi:nucleotide-binding universal stress UspA family protein|nr:universal stress protein [Mycobacterium sp.]
MSYRTIIVGTDGSESSLRAVDRAAALAAQEQAKLIIASAHLDTSEKGGWSRAPAPDRLLDGRAADSLGTAGYRMHGSAPVYAILQDARDHAKAAGAQDIEERAIVGAPVSALLHLAEEVKADLLVVGNLGLSTVAGRLLGSVPDTVARRAKVDILIVHTTG